MDRYGLMPNQLIQPMGCRNCGWPPPHGHLYVPEWGVHTWVMPTQRQIKYRMIRRREWHAATRWIPAGDSRLGYRKWHGVASSWYVPWT